MRRLIPAVLFLTLSLFLSRDETWALPSISDQILTENAVEEIIDQYLSAAQDPFISCNCAEPTVECERVCAPRQEAGWICGTPANQAALAIRTAIEAGAHPWATAKLIAEHPYPLSKMYLLMNHPDAKPLGSLLQESGL